MVKQEQTYIKLSTYLKPFFKNTDDYVIFHVISYWCIYNKVNKKTDNYQKGEYWTYISINAFCKEYVPSTKDKVKSALVRLVKNEWIIADDLKHVECRRTKFYRINYNKLEKVQIYENDVQNWFNIKKSKKSSKPTEDCVKNPATNMYENEESFI